jgi:hypothetical protein
MKDDETITDMQKQFNYFTNRLHMLGKPVPNEASANTILNCLSRE